MNRVARPLDELVSPPRCDETPLPSRGLAKEGGVEGGKPAAKGAMRGLCEDRRRPTGSRRPLESAARRAGFPDCSCRAPARRVLGRVRDLEAVADAAGVTARVRLWVFHTHSSFGVEWCAAGMGLAAEISGRRSFCKPHAGGEERGGLDPDPAGTEFGGRSQGFSGAWRALRLGGRNGPSRDPGEGV